MFDVLSSEQIVNLSWNVVKSSQSPKDIHGLTGKITNSIIHESMAMASLDNITVITITFQNFESSLRNLTEPGKDKDPRLQGQAYG